MPRRTLMQPSTTPSQTYTALIMPPALHPALPLHLRSRRSDAQSCRTSDDWSYFQSRWSEYKAATKIQGNDIVIQLLECCDKQLRKDLTHNTGGSLSGKPEITVMAAIRSLAVPEDNYMVARVQLHQMRQDRDEPIRRFGAHLRGQAGNWKFTMKDSGLRTQDSNCLFNNKIHGNIQRRWNHMWNNCCITWYDTDVLNIHLNINSPYD